MFLIKPLSNIEFIANWISLVVDTKSSLFRVDGGWINSPTCKWIETNRGRKEPFGKALWLLTIATGRIGQPVLAARRAAPDFGLFTLPFSCLVPSKNTPIAQPSFNRLEAVLKASRSPAPLLTE